MISLTSTWAVFLRYTRLWKRDPNLFLFGLYWPVLDILVGGFLGSWIAQAHSSQFYNIQVAALLGILLWQLVGRGCNTMIMTFNEELWSHNVVNFFSLPLRLTEWIGGVILFFLFMMLFVTCVCLLFISLLYDVSLTYILSAYLLFFPPLVFSGIWIGFTSLQILVTFGKRGAELAYIFAWFLLPFSGAYYPIEVLPQWGKYVSYFLPMSYVLEGMRAYVMHQQDPTSYLLKGSVLSVVYAVFAIISFMHVFNRSKKHGLARLTD